MDNERGDPRQRVLKSGTIIFGEKDAVTVACTIRNLSDTGARLQVPKTVVIPGAFKLLYSGTARAAKVAWRKGDQMGIRFDKLPEEGTR